MRATSRWPLVLATGLGVTLLSTSLLSSCKGSDGDSDSTGGAGAGGSSSGGSTGDSGGMSGDGDSGGGTADSGGMSGDGDSGGMSGDGDSGGMTGDGDTGGMGGMGGDGGDPGGCRDFEMPEDCVIRDDEVLPSEIRCTGLYGDWEERSFACGVREYAPSHALWTDGAGKKRYVWLPPGEIIDTSDPDEWRYPVGTKFWKEFYVGPAGEQLLGETRLMEKNELGWIYTAYVWDAEGENALQENAGVEDLFGVGHSVPSREQCRTCHAGREGYILGWDYLMQGAGATGVTIEDLIADDLLSDVPDPLPTIPGDEVEQAALGYLHANCGISCHNEGIEAAGRGSGLFLRLDMAELGSALDTDAVTSGINRLPSPNAELGPLEDIEGEIYDFRPLDPSRSIAYLRMELRGDDPAMPPLGTHLVDDSGSQMIFDWIEAMTEEKGYPAPAP